MRDDMISVIVPVYNSEQYLSMCLNSIITQTYNNIEIICVDDGSTDNSIKILQEYAANDHRIKIVHNKNGGVSAARNSGLDIAKGEYVLFVDSDDWIEKSTCELAVHKMEDKAVDVVMWSYIRERGNESKKKIIFDRDVIFDDKDIREKLHRRMIGIIGKELSHPENADALCTVWGKLYKRSILSSNEIRFYDIRKIGTYEDGLFNLLYFKYVRKAIFLNQYFYHYRRSNRFSITTAYNINLSQQWEELFKIMEEYIKKNNLGKDYKEALHNRISLSLIPLGINEMNHQCRVGIKISNIKKIICRKDYVSAIKQLKIQYMPIYWKIFFIAVRQKNAFIVFIILNIIQKIRGR